MRNIWWAFLFAYSAFGQAPENRPAPEARTWTFREDGRIETQAGVWSYKKGGRIDGQFVRLIGTNIVLVKLVVNGSDGRLSVTSLSEEDCRYLSSISGQPIRARLEREAPRPAKLPIHDFVETKLDPVTGQTTYLQKQPFSLGPAGDPRTLTLQAYVLAEVPDFAAMHFASRCPGDLGWQYLSDRHITFAFEQQKKDFGEPKRIGTTGDGYLLEQFTPRCKLSDFKAMAEAKNVEIRVGHSVFKPSYQMRTAWRSLVAFVQEQHAEVDQ